MTEWVSPDALPTNPAFGRHYPWRAVGLHAMTRGHRSRVDAARRVVDALPDVAGGWRVGLSAGKDSTALGLLLAEQGRIDVRGMSVKDDLDYPGEREYLAALSGRTGMDVDVLTPPGSLEAFLRAERVSLVDDVHSRSAELSRRFFYDVIDAYRAREGYGGVLLGLRGEESRGRKLNANARGVVYHRADGLTVGQPLSTWSAIDVHAFLLARDVPLLPVYRCVDEGAEVFGIRKSWWIAGGFAASVFGHYAWLRRWWPMLWDQAVDIDPNVALLS